MPLSAAKCRSRRLRSTAMLSGFRMKAFLRWRAAVSPDCVCPMQACACACVQCACVSARACVQCAYVFASAASARCARAHVRVCNVRVCSQGLRLPYARVFPTRALLATVRAKPKPLNRRRAWPNARATPAIAASSRRVRCIFKRLRPKRCARPRRQPKLRRGAAPLRRCQARQQHAPQCASSMLLSVKRLVLDRCERVSFTFAAGIVPAVVEADTPAQPRIV